MKLKRNVVLLPTNKESHITLDKSNKNLQGNVKLYPPCIIDDYWENQNLYIISDEEIKDGDWYINGKYIYKREGYYQKADNDRKVIATTDISLNYIKHDDSVPYPKGEQILFPQPSYSFIQKFIEEYNKENIITEVMVEYEPDHSKMPEKIIDVLKVDKDNTITISESKNSWSREEVEELLHSCWIQAIRKNSEPSTEIGFTSWIERNL